MRRSRILTTVLALAVLGLVAVIAWGLDRGFDLTDEGLYMMRYTDPHDESPLWQYEVLLEPVLAPLDPTMMTYRWVRLILTLLSSVVLGLGFLAWRRSSSSPDGGWDLSPVSVVLFITIGGLVGYSHGPITLSYNHLTVIGLQTVTGLLLYFLSRWGRGDGVGAKLALVGVGACLSLQLFVKFPVALSTGVAVVGVVVLIGVIRGLGIGRVLGALGSIAVGGGIGLFYYTSVSGSVPAWVRQVIEINQTLETHRLGDVISGYVVALGHVAKKSMLNPIPILVLLYVSMRVLREVSSTGRRRIYPLLAIIMLATIYHAWAAKWFQSGMLRMLSSLDAYLFVLAALSVMLLGLVPWPEMKSTLASIRGRERTTVAVLLFLVPFLGAFGTANYLRVACTKHVFAWFALIVFLVGIVGRSSRMPALGVIVILFTAGVATLQTWHGFLWSPYRLNGTRMDQTVDLVTPGGDRLRVDPRTDRFVAALDSLLTTQSRFTPGTTMLALNGCPGIVYVLGGDAPGSSWYEQDNPRQNCGSLNRARDHRLDDLVLIVDGDGDLPDAFVSCLASRGVDFPAGYALLGSVPHYYRRERDVSVLVPRSLLRTANADDEDRQGVPRP